MKLANLMELAVASAAALAASGPQVLAAGGGANSNYIIVQKMEQFDQTSGSAPFADPTAPFIFNSSGPLAMSFTPPGGASTPLTFDSGSSKYKFSESFGAQAAMDAAFPNGNYSFSVTGSANFTLSLNGNLYPNTPQVTGGGTWNSSGQLVIDPTQSNTLEFNTFSSYGTAGALSHMQLQIYSLDGSTVSLSQSYITSSNSAPFTSYAIPSGTLAPGGIYYVTLEYDTGPAYNSTAVSGDEAVTVYSATTSFMLVTSGTPSNVPTITQQPSNQTAPVGSNVTFSVNFSGPNNTIVQWFKNGVPVNISNAGNGNGPNFLLSNIQNSDAASYFAILTNGSGPFVQSNTVTLTIGSTVSFPPSFTVEPVSQTVASGSTVAFDAFAGGSPSYQWKFNGNPMSDGGDISGSSGPTLVITGSSGANAGTYTCVATNAFGSNQSNAATLGVSSTTDIGRLINISCRAQVGTGANILISGFAVGGAGTSGAESLLVRASGPALVPFGVAGTLPDPELSIYSGQTLVNGNSGWGSNSTQISAAAASVGAFAWGSTSSHDSALLESLTGGPYTAQVAGQGGDSGVALVEVYDATPAGTYTPTTPRLVNISARVQVGTGGNILIAGFVIGGSTSRTVLIRASGPALAPFGVSGTLPDPKLELYTGSTLLGTNNGWGGNPEISTAAARVGAFSWSTTSSDSAILATLPPGGYTAQISGASNDTGIALIEVYEVP